ncbi:hypothetical protein EH243_11630 [Amphritea opalescens]|uniref:SPOR domain-containing protein n=1 Tax=Amphritea opalescens TaxID=2490544 RepID=A0A430KQG6_9GAMM|nr:SEL1-like repeat protein [Amphritea opalescens]RTE65583.1 hypothetical protein EH243_11630 [Amphritea opalescens]
MARIVFSLLSLLCFCATAVAADDQRCRTFYDNQQTREALHHCLPLAAQGDGEASFILSSLYSQGFEGGSSDLKQALKWLTRSAEQGYAPGCYNLAALYDRGEVVPQDMAAAFRWYLEGAKLDHLASQLQTGLFYLKGKGVEQDYVQAHHWLAIAANRGDQRAQVTLATLLKATKPAESVKLFQRAAQSGNSYAYYQLALLFREPPAGISMNLNQALEYALESEKLGYQPAVDLVESIKQQQVLEEAHRVALAALTEAELTGVESSPAPAVETVIAEPVTPVDDVQAEDLASQTVPKESNQQSGPDEPSVETVASAASSATNDAQTETEAQKEVQTEVSLAERESTEVVVANSAVAPVEKRTVTPKTPAVKPLGDSSANTHSAATEANVDLAGLRDFTWLMAQPRQHYVLQLAQLSSDESVNAYLRDNKLQGRVNFFKAVTAAGNKYVVLYAESATSLQGAKQIAATELPKKLSGMVWFRTYHAIQNAYKPVD